MGRTSFGAPVMANCATLARPREDEILPSLVPFQRARSPRVDHFPRLDFPITRERLGLFNAALELGRKVEGGPHPAIVGGGGRGEGAAVAAHGVALERIGHVVAVVVVNVEVDGRAGAPVVAVRGAGLEVHTLLLALARGEGGLERGARRGGWLGGDRG